MSSEHPKNISHDLWQGRGEQFFIHIYIYMHVLFPRFEISCVTLRNAHVQRYLRHCMTGLHKNRRGNICDCDFLLIPVIIETESRLILNHSFKITPRAISCM